MCKDPPRVTGAARQHGGVRCGAPGADALSRHAPHWRPGRTVGRRFSGRITMRKATIGSLAIAVSGVQGWITCLPLWSTGPPLVWDSAQSDRHSAPAAQDDDWRRFRSARIEMTVCMHLGRWLGLAPRVGGDPWALRRPTGMATTHWLGASQCFSGDPLAWRSGPSDDLSAQRRPSVTATHWFDGDPVVRRRPIGPAAAIRPQASRQFTGLAALFWPGRDAQVGRRSSGLTPTLRLRRPPSRLADRLAWRRPVSMAATVGLATALAWQRR